MAKVNFVEANGQLTMVKDKADSLRRWGLIAGVGLLLAVAGLFALWFTGVYGGVILLAGLVALLLAGPQAWQVITKGAWVTFDRPADSVSENGKPLGKVSELKGIEVESYTRLSKEGKPYFTRYYTNLLMADGKQKEIDYSTEVANAEAIGSRVAAYLGIELQHKNTVRQEGVNA